MGGYSAVCSYQPTLKTFFGSAIIYIIKIFTKYWWNKLYRNQFFPNPIHSDDLSSERVLSQCYFFHAHFPGTILRQSFVHSKIMITLSINKNRWAFSFNLGDFLLWKLIKLNLKSNLIGRQSRLLLLNDNIPYMILNKTRSSLTEIFLFLRKTTTKSIKIPVTLFMILLSKWNRRAAACQKLMRTDICRR